MTPTLREAPPSSLPTGHETILVVDDSPEMRQVAERHLRFLGYAVLTAEHGPAALALLRAGTPVDLLFTDIAMPEGTERLPARRGGVPDAPRPEGAVHHGLCRHAGGCRRAGLAGAVDSQTVPPAGAGRENPHGVDA